MTYADNPSSFRNETFEDFHVESPVALNRNYSDLERDSVLEKLPRHYVGMMLHYSQNKFVAGFEPGASETRSNKIQRLGCPASEDYLFGRSRVDKTCDTLARLFLTCGGFLTEGVDSAVDISFSRRITGSNGFDNRLGCLARCRVVEVYKRSVIEPALKYREI